MNRSSHLSVLIATIVLAVAAAAAASAQTATRTSNERQSASASGGGIATNVIGNGNTINVSSANAAVLSELKSRMREEARLLNELKKAVASIQAMKQAPTTAPAANHALAALQAGDSAPSVALLHDQEANVARQAEQNASSAAADKHKAAELARQQGALAFFTDTEGALKAYQRAAGYEPDDPDTLIFIGDLQDRLGQTQQALTTFDQARALLERKRAASPDNAALLSDLAVAHDRMGVEIQKQGNLESALAHFRQALAIAEAGSTGSVQPGVATRSCRHA
jgi:tetratricopeptide (TPR) repeat protein